MAEEGKKISFSFSKSIKKSALKNVPPPVQKKVDYIECVDDNSIKIVGGEEKKDDPLVIPMLGSKTWHERIINKVDADIFEPKTTQSKTDNQSVQGTQIKQEKVDNVPNGHISNENIVQPMEVSEIKKEPDTDQSLTLEQQAAREIIADLKFDEGKGKEQAVFTVPVTSGDDLKGQEESTLEDYENIPIDAFGMAMLRGMGWQPGKGIGKNQKVVPPAIPELRPKGMGLGADKLAVQKAKGKLTKEEQQLKLVKGSYVKIVAGKHSSSYGKIEGFDEDAARIIIKLALGDEAVSVNEFWVQPVTSTEYSQNSKVLNVKKYQEYKSNEASKSDRPKQETRSANSSDDENHKSKRSEKSKKKSKKRRQSSDDDSSTDRKSRRKRNSSNSSDEDQKQKKSKKTKKHKSRDSSFERSSRKNRKKDKEREKIRHKKSDYSDPSERARHKKQGRRSRSRSCSPRNCRRERSRSYSPRR